MKNCENSKPVMNDIKCLPRYYKCTSVELHPISKTVFFEFLQQNLAEEVSLSFKNIQHHYIKYHHHREEQKLKDMKLL